LPIEIDYNYLSIFERKEKLSFLISEQFFLSKQEFLCKYSCSNRKITSMKGQSGLKSVNLYCNTVKFSMETDFNYKTSFERKDKISFFNI